MNNLKKQAQYLVESERFFFSAYGSTVEEAINSLMGSLNRVFPIEISGEIVDDEFKESHRPKTISINIFEIINNNKRKIGEKIINT